MAADARVTQVGVEADAVTDTSGFTFKVTQVGVEAGAVTDTTPFKIRVTQVGIEVLHRSAVEVSTFHWST